MDIPEKYSVDLPTGGPKNPWLGPDHQHHHHGDHHCDFDHHHHNLHGGAIPVNLGSSLW